MLLVYTIFSTFLFLLLLPVLSIAVSAKKKYRGRTLQRLGLTLPKQLSQPCPDRHKPTIWIHALSVGEVTSALPLLRGLRKKYPHATLYFSTATKSGQATAARLISPFVNALFYSPFDLYFSVHRFIHLLNPSLFILVETDFWPCWLWQLRKNRGGKIVCLLVNGRFSKQAINGYQRFRLLFRPMFNCFDLLSLQTVQDCTNLKKLGISENKIITLGNLKFDAGPLLQTTSTKNITRKDLRLTDSGPIFICGSTHEGEENILLAAWKIIIRDFPDLTMILAPRDIRRACEIASFAHHLGLMVTRRSEQNGDADILLLDTLGELADCYVLADIAFVGGSLVQAGGHNPLEPAAAGIPILFGPHMEDFSEISRDLIEVGGANQVTDSADISHQVTGLLSDGVKRQTMGKAAKKYIIDNHGVVDNHLQIIDQLLKSRSRPSNG